MSKIRWFGIVMGLLMVTFSIGHYVGRMNQAKAGADISWRDAGQFLTLDIPDAHGFTIYVDTDGDGKIHTYVLAMDSSPKKKVKGYQHEWVYIGSLWEENDDGCVCKKCGMSRPWAIKNNARCTKK